MENGAGEKLKAEYVRSNDGIVLRLTMEVPEGLTESEQQFVGDQITDALTGYFAEERTRIVDEIINGTGKDAPVGLLKMGEYPDAS